MVSSSEPGPHIIDSVIAHIEAGAFELGESPFMVRSLVHEDKDWPEPLVWSTWYWWTPKQVTVCTPVFPEGHQIPFELKVLEGLAANWKDEP